MLQSSRSQDWAHRGRRWVSSVVPRCSVQSGYSMSVCGAECPLCTPYLVLPSAWLRNSPTVRAPQPTLFLLQGAARAGGSVVTVRVAPPPRTGDASSLDGTWHMSLSLLGAWRSGDFLASSFCASVSSSVKWGYAWYWPHIVFRCRLNVGVASHVPVVGS